MLLVGLLPAYTHLEHPESLSIADATTSPGFFAAVKAMFSAAEVGKQAADMTANGYTLINGPRGVTLSLDAAGHVNGVFDGATATDIMASGSGVAYLTKPFLDQVARAFKEE